MIIRTRVKIIANPFSGGGRAGRLARDVAGELRRRGCAVDLCQTLQAGDARRAASETGGYDAVGCVGGDGTVNEVVNGLSGPVAPPLAVLPSGTANVLAKELRLPRDPEGLARVILEGPEVRWDLGIDWLSSRKLLLFASTGYDAHLVHLFHAARPRSFRVWSHAWANMGLYLVWALRSVQAYSAPRIRVALDGRPVADDATWVLISNVASYGGPFVFTLRARPDDGVFEVMVQRARRRRDVLRMFWTGILNYLFGTDHSAPDVTFHRAREVRLAGEDGRAAPVQIDGDPAGRLPVQFEVIAGAIRILVP